MDAQGKEVPGARGYKYFGRAKELPGVKELFQPPRMSARKRSSGLYVACRNNDRAAFRQVKWITNRCHLFFFFSFNLAVTLKEKTRGELLRNVDADYYGYRDEEDGTLLEFEEEQE